MSGTDTAGRGRANHVLRPVVIALVATAAATAVAVGVLATIDWLGSSGEDPRLTWNPPALTDPKMVAVSNDNRSLKLDDGSDYVIEMPDTPLTAPGGLSVSGGHNVVLIGGEIAIPWQGDDPPSHSRRGLLLKNQTGTVHVEGLLIRGEDVAEGIDIDEGKGATVQLQNVRVDNVHRRDTDPDSFHPDIIQAWAGPSILRIDGLTGDTNYQGLFLTPNTHYDGPPPTEFDLRRVDLAGDVDSGVLLWLQEDPPVPVALADVWVQGNPSKVFPDQIVYPGPSAWPGVNQGSPPDGSFVEEGSAGVDYESPGYR